jgi:iron(III) transport system substrate-binding protein
MKRWMIVGLSLGLAATMAACGSDGGQATVAEGGFDAIVKAAQEEGSLVWYSDLPDAVIESTSKGFEEKYKIKVSHTRAVQGQLAQRFSSEMKSKSAQADVMNIASKAFFSEGVKNGWFAKLSANEVASIADWPQENFYDGAFAVINVQPLGIAYNTKTSKVQPQDWEQLLVPELKGRVIMGDPGITAYTQLFQHLRQELGDEALTGIRDLDPQVTDSMVPGTQSMAAGEFDVTVPALKAVVQPLIDQGAPIELVIPESTTGVNQYGGVVEGARHPNAARLFMSYVLSRDGQEKLTAGIAASVLDDIPGAMPLPSGFAEVSEDEALAQQEKVKELLGS